MRELVTHPLDSGSYVPASQSFPEFVNNVVAALVARGELLGPQGAQGPEGPPGPSGVVQTYIHSQDALSTDWIIDHNRGAYPIGVTVSDFSGNTFIGAVEHPTVNRTIVRFSQPIAGRAVLA